MKKTLTLLFVLLISATAFAATGLQYKSSPEGLFAAGGNADGATYSSDVAVGEDVTGVVSSTAYSNAVGFIASSVTYASQEAGYPSIAALRFDGREIVSGDYVNADVVITAVITDAADSINTSASSLEIDSTVITFAALTSESSFNINTGLLTYKPSPDLSDGLHSLRITAVNSAGNAMSGYIEFRVSGGSPTAINGDVLPYPNPYDPTAGNVELAYRLNTDAKVTIYVFNSVGQQVWKFEIAQGSEGGHAGYNFVAWNGTDNFGNMLANGIYFIRLVSGGNVIGRGKLAVIK